MEIKIDPQAKTAIYRQIVLYIQQGIREGLFKGGDMLPSMNELAAKQRISKETVKKAYGILVDMGDIVPKQGKGFYIATAEEGSRPHILLIFDKFSVYKQIVYNAFQERLGTDADITILNHNQSADLLEYYLDNYLDNYDYYVVSPHFPLDAHTQERVVKLLRRIPFRKLILIDHLQPGLSGNFGAVYQDFGNDIYDCLSGIQLKDRLRVYTLPTSMYGPVICSGVKRYAAQQGVTLEFMTAPPEDIRRGDTFLILNSQLDAGLVALVRKIREKGLSIGEDVKIISYNEYHMNELVLGGLTTVSADFPAMGRLAADMILSRTMSKVHCPFRMTRRSTF